MAFQDEQEEEHEHGCILRELERAWGAQSVSLEGNDHRKQGPVVASELIAEKELCHASVAGEKERGNSELEKLDFGLAESYRQVSPNLNRASSSVLDHEAHGTENLAQQ